MKPGIELAGKRVLVVGLARTGVATAQFCIERGESRRHARRNDAPERAAAPDRGMGQEFYQCAHSILPLRMIPTAMPSIARASRRGSSMMDL